MLIQSRPFWSSPFNIRRKENNGHIKSTLLAANRWAPCSSIYHFPRISNHYKNANFLIFIIFLLLHSCHPSGSLLFSSFLFKSINSQHVFNWNYTIAPHDLPLFWKIAIWYRWEQWICLFPLLFFSSMGKVSTKADYLNSIWNLFNLHGRQQWLWIGIRLEICNFPPMAIWIRSYETFPSL